MRLRQMRCDDALGSLPVNILSGMADEAGPGAPPGKGAGDFLPGPAGTNGLVARIEANVRLVRLRRDALWRQGEQFLMRLRQSQQELLTLLDTVQRVRADERRMLARELHDQLGQTLSAAKIISGCCRSALPIRRKACRASRSLRSWTRRWRASARRSRPCKTSRRCCVPPRSNKAG